MTPEQHSVLLKATAEARKAGHIFPEMAACEAALESAYGTSLLAIQDNNLFGMKQHQHPVFGTHVLPTKEFENGQWITINSSWISYPDWPSCFSDRMSTLQRLASYLPHYKSALEAQDPRSYVIQVSESWSTDPGWECKCCAMFSTEAEASEHASDWQNSDEHSYIQRLPGLGRALKVLKIYDQFTAAPDADGEISV